MKNLNQIRHDFEKNGYVVIPGLVEDKNIPLYREKVLNFFKKSPNQRMMMPSDTINEFSEVFNLQTNVNLLSACKEIFGEFSYVNDFQIQKNMCNQEDIGWHHDGGASFSVKGNNIDEISKNINNQYRIAKIGISLTESDCPYGQMIDVVEGSHKWKNLKRALVNKLLNSKFVPKIIKSYIFDNMNGKISSGDCVIFDSGLLHRSQMAKINNVPNYRNKASYEISDDSKLTIYFEVGNKDSCKWYVKNNLTYANTIERGDMEEKYYSDYLRFDKSIYPESYLNELSAYNVSIAELDTKDRLIASEIYKS